MNRTIKYGLLILGLTLCIGLLIKGSVTQVPSGTWAPTGSMMEMRAGASCARLQDGRILVTGGEGSSGPSVTAELFHSDGSYSSAVPMDVPRRNHISVVLADGRVLVAGGTTTGGGVTNAAEIYDPASGLWASVTGGMVEARSGHTASALPNGQVLIAGGQSGSVVSATLELFDTTSGSFRFVGLLSSGRTGQAAAVLSDGRVLIAGGTNGSGSLATTDLYDPASGSLTPGPALNVPRSGLSATLLLDGRVLLAGGSSGGEDLATAEVYDPATGMLAMSGPMGVARRDHLAFLLPHNNQVLIVGGTFAGAPLASAELYRPWTGLFQPTGTLAAPRSAATGSPLTLDGLLLVTGGTDQSSSELYGFATVRTDKDDYAPGEIVTITGSGWQPGETVSLVLHEVDNPAPHEDRTLTAVADAYGRIFNNQFAPEHHDIGVRFYLLSSGEISAQNAQTTFTDGTPVIQSVVDSPFSPNQPSSGGTRDTIVINVRNQGSGAVADFRVRIRVGTTSGTLVREFLLGNVNGNTNGSVTWDGKNSASSFVADGTYIALASNGTSETTSPASQTGVIVVDNTNPTVTLLAPANNATVSGNFNLEAAPLDGSNDSNIDRVEFYVDGNHVGTDNSPGGGWRISLNAGSFANGSHTWFVKAFDKAGNNAVSASRTFNIGPVDTTPPVVTPNVSGTLGNNGWYVSNVTVTWTVTDPESTVSSTTGCDASNVTSDTAGTTFTCQATSAGGTTSQSVIIKRDATAPTLSFGPASPAANSNGWNNTDVSFSFTTDDNLSGVASSSPASPLVLMTEGASVTGSVMVTDLAGNSATFLSPAVKIDKTAPTASAAASPAANSNGWNNTDVMVTFTGSDGLSGIDSCTAPTVLSSEGMGQSASGTCTDKAGNISNPATQSGINIDKTAPVITGSRTPLANPHGWNNTDVTVSFSCTDGLSGLAPGSPPDNTVVSAEGANQSVNGTCSDRAGNTATNNIGGISIDKTLPVAAAFRAPLANAYGWNNTDVTVTFSGSDGLSGIAGCTPASVLSSEGMGQSASGTCTDKAGNTGSPATQGGINIDKTAPALPANVLANPAAINTQGTLTAIVSDSPSPAPSNIIKAEYTINGASALLMSAAAGFSFPGSPVNVTANIPLQPVGVYNLCVRAQDRADNYSPQECTLFAVYDPNGGFVTGGGWINSPAGAYTMDLSLSGKANFGFVSKYQKGATIPVGQTEFQFKAGDLNFHSSAYEWLVISGSRAQYKGSGKINGAGDYGFILTAIDGDLNGGGGLDKFRIKIQDKSSGTVVYDNQFGTGDDATPTTAVAGGSIQIKK
ncbi:MAG: kelch repeat-containing protein [Acidobacteriota bacterium]